MVADNFEMLEPVFGSGRPVARRPFRRICWAVLAVCWMSSSRVRAAERVFERLGPEDGLSHNTVNTLVQDRDGFLWIGTDDGLNRFDGRVFRVFRFPLSAASTGTSNRVTALLEDSSRRLWVGTARGLHLLDRSTGQFVRVDLPVSAAAAPDREVMTLIEDEKGRIWTGSGGEVFALSAGRDTFQRIPLDVADLEHAAELKVTCLREDGSGRVWAIAGEIGRPEAFLHRFAEGSSAGKTIHLVGQDYLRTFAIHESQLWVAADVRGDVSESFAFSEVVSPPVPGQIQDLVVTQDGSFWVGSSLSLYEKAATSNRWTRHTVLPSQRSWQANHVNTIYQDASSTLWVGTLGGLFFSDPNRKPFVHRYHDPHDPASLGGEAVSSIAQGRDDALWIATYGGGIDRTNSRLEILERIRHDPNDARSLISDTVWSIHVARDGVLWVGTEIGLCSRSPGRHEFDVYDIRAPDAPTLDLRIKIVAEHPDGSLWLGTNHGLFRFYPDTRDYTHFGSSADERGLSFRQIGSLLVVDAEEVWIGTTDGQLDRLRVSAGRFERRQIRTTAGDAVNNVHIFDLRLSKSGELWFATGLGFGRLRRETGMFEYPLLADRLPGSVVFSLIEDRTGVLWLGTNYGLARVDPSAEPDEGLRVYDLADGVGNLEYNRHAALEGRDGRLFFGGMTGLTAFVPQDVTDDPHPPPVALTEIKILGDAGERVVEPFGLERLILAPSDHSVSFEFAALSFTSPEKSRFAYRLEDLDAAWVDAGTRSHGRYTHLPPGEYQLRVKAANHDGAWNDQGVTLPLTVQPAYWQTWWFRGLVLFLGATLLLLIHRMRTSRLVELERVRLGIAADLHDELGSDLSGIALVAGMIADHEGLQTRDRRRLHDIQSTAWRVMLGLRDIVWYIDPEHDRLGAMVSRMRVIAETLLEGIAVEFVADNEWPDRAVAMSIRRNVLLVYKEALHNIRRHAGSCRVRIEVAIVGSALRLVVADDGSGFDSTRAADGSGLRNMRRRAQQLGARLGVVTRPGEGTRIELNTPLRP